LLPVSASELLPPVEAGVGDEVVEALPVGLVPVPVLDPVPAAEVEVDGTDEINVEDEPERVELRLEAAVELVLVLITVLTDADDEDEEPDEPTGSTFPPSTVPDEEEELVPAAADFKAVISLLVAGFTIPTMPPWQWVGVAQKKKMGSRLVTVTWKISAAVTEPESNPPLLCEHGSVELPCTAV